MQAQHLTVNNTLADLADELGSIRAEMAALKVRETEIKALLVDAGFDAVEGNLFRAAIAHQVRTIIDYKAIIAKLQPSRQLLAAHTSKREVVLLRVSGLKK